MDEDELVATIGHRFPGGRACIEPYVDWLLRDVVLADRSAGTDTGDLHPTAAFLAAQRGVGMELEEIFALFGAASADGPMLGEWAVDYARPLRAGVGYTVRAVVENAVRRRGARTGVFDVVTLLIELVGDDGAVHAAVRPSYVFPRRTGGRAA
jgi:hypothetical protein